MCCHNKTEQNSKPLNHILASFATITDAFSVLLKLAELEFRCEGDRLFVEYASEREVEYASEGEVEYASEHEAAGHDQGQGQGTAAHVIGLGGGANIGELEAMFGGLRGYKGVLVGECPFPSLLFSSPSLLYTVSATRNRAL